MKTAIAHLKSVSPYSQSKHIDPTLKKDKESAKDFEARCWKERLHVDKEGWVFVPPTAFKNCLSEAAKYLSIQIPGKGKSTFTKHFESGVLVVEGLQLPVKKEDVKGTWLFLPSDGKRGGGKRVEKCMPTIPEWEGKVQFLVLDETITEEVFTHVITEAGKFIGIGFFRPRNNGFWGRFEVVGVKWA